MRISLLFVLALISSSSAVPGLIPGLFIPLKPPPFYTRLLYPFLFPKANYVGAFLGPLLKQIIGDRTLEFLDETADFFCISAGADPSGKGGVCQRALAGLYELGTALTPARRLITLISVTYFIYIRRRPQKGQSKRYKDLLAVLCVAPNTQPPLGTCQALLEMADCVANRILQVKDLECTGEGDDDGDE